MSLEEEEVEELQSILEQRKEGSRETPEDWNQEDKYGDFVWKESKYSIRIEQQTRGSIELPKSNGLKFFQTFWIMARNDESLYSAMRKVYHWRTKSTNNLKPEELEKFTDNNGYLTEGDNEDVMAMLDSQDALTRYID